MRLDRKLEGIILGGAIGLVAGLGMYTFIYAKGASYLTNNPAACANCHIMQEHYDGWIKSSHRSVAGCNDCHTPSGFIAKYAAKASNGFWHSFAFTTGRFHEPLQIKQHNREITENACRTCHQEIVGSIDGAHAAKGDAQLSCIRCHNSVGHMR
ncbi:MAG TPA: cytochrome c nitrite reductase small subunit [Blastocatellia bacterium]|nr:cytochrome c nitrite reductase small subunit [Blastocatellia bacterium]